VIRSLKSKVTVWRWQERFMTEGIAGLRRDKTRPSRIPRLPTAVRSPPNPPDRHRSLEP
jgi:hypothetical protein